MRIAVGLLMCLGGASTTWATDPPAQTPSPAAAPSASTPAATPTPTTPAATPSAAKTTELTADEKNYLSHGYKLQIKGGQKYFCRSEAEVGSRFAKTTCRTSEQMAVVTQNSKDFAAEMERPSGNRTGH